VSKCLTNWPNRMLGWATGAGKRKEVAVNLRSDVGMLLLLTIGFLVCFFLPVDAPRFQQAVLEALHLVRWYAREHVLLCLVPAFFIAGAIAVFVSQAAVMRYLGAQASKIVAYGVASVSGTILAVCSCTVLPLFAGIWRMGAGLGPACAFLYSGPAINVLAIVLTARILGLELGIARALGAVVFSIVIGLTMHLIFRREERVRNSAQAILPETSSGRPLWQTAVYFFVMVGILVFANWGCPREYELHLAEDRPVRAAVLQAPGAPDAARAVWRVRLLDGTEAGRIVEIPASRIRSAEPVPGLWTTLWRYKWWITSVLGLVLGGLLVLWFGVPFRKVVAAGVPPVVLVLIAPHDGAWIMLPFAAAVLGLAVVLKSTGGEAEAWLNSTWGFAKQILPLLFAGVLAAGLLLGRLGHEGLIPAEWVHALVGGNSVRANLSAAGVGAFMYFATLTEVPILQGLLAHGMGKGPALALLLAGPALSLPNMLVVRGVLGARKTLTYILLVVGMSTLAGLAFGAVWG